jgi:subtilase family serine protease
VVHRNRRPKAAAAVVVLVSLLAVAVPAAAALDLGPIRRSVQAFTSIVPVCPPVTGQVHCDSLRLTDVNRWKGVARGASSPAVAPAAAAGTLPTVPQLGNLLGALLGGSPTTTTTRPSPTTSSTSSTTTTTRPSSTTTSTSTPPSTHKGYGPADIQDAYNLPAASAGLGQTVAVVDPFDNPQAEADLAVYRSYYGLPPCTTANGCFKKVDQRGGTSYPTADAAWAQETALDIDMVSAACPNCNILLVEADSGGVSDVAKAENTAATLGANVISNSFSADESLVATGDESAYHHPGIAIVASSGDGGYNRGPQFPASSADVTAVGGTTLKRNSSARGWSETAWKTTGGGCSSLFAKPAWQNDSGCTHRTIADVAAVGDPATGVAVYDSFDDGQGTAGWLIFGGTSVAAPIVAGAYALAGNAASAGPGYPYAHAGEFNDITSGTNGTCTPAYLCTAGPGYDGPTGLGTPNGVAGL